MEFSENLKKADINIASSGDNTIIAAPANGYIVIDHINFIPTTAVSVQLKDGATAYGGSYPLDAKQAFVLENAMRSEKGVVTLTPKTAFVINLSGATQVSGFIRYRIIGE
jgi:hypothetical protein